MTTMLSAPFQSFLSCSELTELVTTGPTRGRAGTGGEAGPGGALMLFQIGNSKEKEKRDRPTSVMNTERLIHYVFVAGENPEHLRKLKQASLRSAGLAFVYIGSYEAPVPNSGIPISCARNLLPRYHSSIFYPEAHGKGCGNAREPFD